MPSDPSEAESVRGPEAKASIDPLLLALGLWCEDAGISRGRYQKLYEVYNTQPKGDNFVPIPKKLDTLKRLVRGVTPLICLMRKKVPVFVDKQPSLSQTMKRRRGKKQRKEWQYWFDPKDLVSKILSADMIADKMHVGMAQYVDNPDEYYHSRSWGSSTISTSEQFAHAADGTIILPGDIVRFTSEQGGYTKVRVIFVGVDHRSTARVRGEVVLTMQPVISSSYLARELGVNIPGLRSASSSKLLLLDTTIELTEPDIMLCLEVEMDFTWDLEAPRRMQASHNTHFIRQIVDVDSGTWTSLRYTHPLQADLEVAHYGRENIEGFERRDIPSISLPLILFLDDFGVFRTTH